MNKEIELQAGLLDHIAFLGMRLGDVGEFPGGTLELLAAELSEQERVTLEAVVQYGEEVASGGPLDRARELFDLVRFHAFRLCAVDLEKLTTETSAMETSVLIALQSMGRQILLEDFDKKE